MKSFAVTTLGCKVNSYESEHYIAELKKLGYQQVFDKDIADIYIINTCAVTNMAAAKSRQKISSALKLNPEALICVVGCYVQIAAESLAEKYQIDILVGSDQKQQLPHLIDTATKNRPQKIVNNVRNNVEFEDLFVRHFQHQTRAFLKIQDGCNQFCSFCIIPFTRGKERSLELSKVVDNLRALFLSHQEVVLAGIHTGRYLTDENDFTKLLMTIAKEFSFPKRIRISSIEINEITPEIIKLFKNNEIFAKHLHIPLQSGNDKILKAMERHYSTSEFMTMLNQIRKELPDYSISTDVIVGFPGESEADFLITKDFIKRAEFSFLHVFPYSLRANTVAAKLDNHVDGVRKQLRVKELIDLSQELLENFQQKFYNKEVVVLFERKNKNNNYIGHSSEYLQVEVTSSNDLIGTYQKVKITEFKNQICYGEILGEVNGETIKLN